MMRILPIAFILDLLIPFTLAPAYKGYNHLTQVMSVLGNSKAPLHSVYNTWLVVFGITLAVTNFKVYAIVSEFKADCSNPFCHIAGLCNRWLYPFRLILCRRRKKS